MPEYIISGTTPNGRKVTESVIAPSAAAAVERWRTAGYTDIELHTDDMSCSPEGNRRGGLLGVRAPAKDTIRFTHASPSRAFLLTMWLAYRDLAVPVAVFAAILLVRRVRAVPVDYTDYLGLLALCAPPLVWLVIPRLAGIHHRMQRASAAARWHEVLALLPRLERQAHRAGNAPFAVNLAGHRARALLGLGRRDEAFAVIAALEHRPDVPRMRYFAALASLHTQLEEFEAAEECWRKGIAAEPENPTCWLGLAELLSFYLERPTDARAALERVRSFDLATVTKSILVGVEAAIALGEHRDDEARRLFEQEAKQLARMVPGTPIAEALLRRTQVKLVIACARLGDIDAAQRHFSECKPYLVAHDAQSWLARCRDALAAAESAAPSLPAA